MIVSPLRGGSRGSRLGEQMKMKVIALEPLKETQSGSRDRSQDRQHDGKFPIPRELDAKRVGSTYLLDRRGVIMVTGGETGETGVHGSSIQ
jgi:hypothetical protein